jgi:hypothetical protein
MFVRLDDWRANSGDALFNIPTSVRPCSYCPSDNFIRPASGAASRICEYAFTLLLIYIITSVCPMHNAHVCYFNNVWFNPAEPPRPPPSPSHFPLRFFNPSNPPPQWEMRFSLSRFPIFSLLFRKLLLLSPPLSLSLSTPIIPANSTSLPLLLASCSFFSYHFYLPFHLQLFYLVVATSTVSYTTPLSLLPQINYVQWKPWVSLSLCSWSSAPSSHFHSLQTANLSLPFSFLSRMRSCARFLHSFSSAAAKVTTRANQLCPISSVIRSSISSVHKVLSLFIRVPPSLYTCPTLRLSYCPSEVRGRNFAFALDDGTDSFLLSVRLQGRLHKYAEYAFTLLLICVMHSYVKKHQNVRIRDPPVPHFFICRDQRSTSSQ